MIKILSDLLMDFPKWRTYACLLGTVKLKEEEESQLLEKSAIRLGEFCI